MKKEILEEKVYYYTDVIEDPKALVDAIESDNADEWGEWAACSGQHYVYGTDKNISLSDENDEKNNYIYSTLQKAFDDVARDYAKAQGITDEPKLFPMYPIKKYQAGTYMGAHFDQLDGDTTLRYSIVMYLNDDFEGGEISFSLKDYENNNAERRPHEDYDNEQNNNVVDFGIKPKAGSVIIFPSSAPYYHTAHLVKSKFKYMVPSHWIHNNMDFQGSMW